MLKNFRPNRCHYCRGVADECQELPGGELYSCESCRTLLGERAAAVREFYAKAQDA